MRYVGEEDWILAAALPEIWYICSNEVAGNHNSNLSKMAIINDMRQRVLSKWSNVAISLFLGFAGCVLLSVGCKKSSGNDFFGATGKPMDVIVVLPQEYNTPEVKAHFAEAFGQPFFVLPQVEPMQNLMYTVEQNFSTMFKTMRNIIYVSIDPDKYSGPKVSVSKDDFASGQLLLHLKSNTIEGLYRILESRGANLSDLIYREELNRLSQDLERTYASKATASIEQEISGVTIRPRVDLEYLKAEKGFVWASNQGGLKEGRSDLIVYSFPMTDSKEVTFTRDYMMHKRDSIMQIHMPGQYEGSYMQTSQAIMPRIRHFELNGSYRMEMRGLWEMSGDMMGGPFISHALINDKTDEVVVAEVLVFKPNEKKRNLLMYHEASLLTFKLLDETN